MSQNQIESWEIAIAIKRVKKWREKWAILKVDELRDHVHDCLAYWFQEKKNYNPRHGASQKTFMAGVLEMYLSHKKDALLAKKRKAFFEAQSLDEFFNEESDSSSENRKHEPSVFENPNIRVDISIAVQKLNPYQREICRLIQSEGMSFYQIGKHLNKHHSHVYREVERIREIFEQEGLKDYLRNF
jgi:DNA-directed RNA polymerase specialized sigma24 family protein